MATRKYVSADGAVFDTAKDADAHDARQPLLTKMDDDMVRDMQHKDILCWFERNFRAPVKRAKKVKPPTPTPTPTPTPVSAAAKTVMKGK
jgi:hypothetical protein